MTQEMSVDICRGEQIDRGKLTELHTDGRVQKDKGRDGQQGLE